MPNDGSFEAYAAITRAALRQPQGKIAALPGGELTVTKVLDTRLQDGGRTQALALYAITGIDTRPGNSGSGGSLRQL